MTTTIETFGGKKSPEHGIPPVVRNIVAGSALVIAAAGAAIGVRSLSGGEHNQNSVANTGNTTSAPKQENKPQTASELSFKATEFEAKTIDGQTVRLSDYKGKPVIIFYWGEPYGPGETEMTNLTNSIIDLAAQNKDKGVVLLTIAIDAGVDAKTIAGKTSPILIDPANKPNPGLRAYFNSYPAVVFIKPDGTFTEETTMNKEVAFLQDKIGQLP